MAGKVFHWMSLYFILIALIVTKLMETRGVLTGRSWHSMKERFRKVIMKKIRSYGLSEETVQRFLTKCRNRLNTV